MSVTGLKRTKLVLVTRLEPEQLRLVSEGDEKFQSKRIPYFPPKNGFQHKEDFYTCPLCKQQHRAQKKRKNMSACVQTVKKKERLKY